MPVEIKELVIKTTVTSGAGEDDKKEDKESGADCSNCDEDKEANQIKEDVLKVCLESVNSMLRRLNDR
jgi:hypothetical protein